jgi:hypothetical protein
MGARRAGHAAAIGSGALPVRWNGFDAKTRVRALACTSAVLLIAVAQRLPLYKKGDLRARASPKSAGKLIA